MELLFGIWAIGYFFNLMPLEQTVKTVVNVVFIIVFILMLFGLPFAHMRVG